VFHWEASWFLCFFTADSLVLTENRDRAVQFPGTVAHLSSIAVAPPARVSKVGSGGCAGGIISGESWAVFEGAYPQQLFTFDRFSALAVAYHFCKPALPALEEIDGRLH
jgi:hypothetical protein